MFQSAADSSHTELIERISNKNAPLRLGIKFLDDALGGISAHDLVVLGAPSGVGKTQLCCNVALANIEDGKRVHYIALEAAPFEIERRLKYQLFANAYYLLDSSLRRGRQIKYQNWLRGFYSTEFRAIEDYIADDFAKKFQNLFIYYKQGDFGLPQMIELVAGNAHKSDLILIDHAQYFDLDDDNENRGLKDIAKTARTLALEKGKPIILVSHLRKKDKQSTETCAGLDELHGSSDLAKIATKVVTMAPGQVTESGEFITYFRTPKNRDDGSVTRYIGRVLYDAKRNLYAKTYKVGLAASARNGGFEELDPSYCPDWSRQQAGGDRDSNA